MKKIILILCTLLLTGCYDYVEINDLSFVSCIGIDKKNDKFSLTFEILNDTKTSSEQSSQKGYTITESGKTLANAFDNISLKIAKTPYFYHLKSIVISEDVAKTNMKELIEFVTRDPEIKTGFYLVIAKDVSAEDIVKNSTESNPIVGNQITKLIESNVKGYNITYNKSFEDVLETFLNDKRSPITSTITLKDKEIAALGIGIFNNFEYQTTLSKEESSYLNLLLNEQSNFLLEKNYDQNKVIVNISDNKTKIEFKENKIIFDITMEAEIKENMSDFDFRKEETYIKLGKDFSKIIKDELNTFISKMQKVNIDILGLENAYYKKTKKKNANIFKESEIIINTTVEINKKGLIFEVNHE